MADEPRSAKDRSPNFPFIPLATALRRAEEFYAKEKRGSAPFPIAARHWGLSSKSSGALQTAAALKSYGLMSDEGTGAARKLRLTELALRIILDSRPDSTEKRTHMQQAALTPAVAAEVYNLWPDGLPSAANLHHHLVLERKFNEATARKVVKIIHENHSLTSLDSSGQQESVSGNDDDIGKTASVAPTSVLRRSFMPSLDPADAMPKPTIPPFGATTERIVVGDGEAVLTIQFRGSPTAEVFDFLAQYGAFRKKVLKPD